MPRTFVLEKGWVSDTSPAASLPDPATPPPPPPLPEPPPLAPPPPSMPLLVLPVTPLSAEAEAWKTLPTSSFSSHPLGSRRRRVP